MARHIIRDSNDCYIEYDPPAAWPAYKDEYVNFCRRKRHSWDVIQNGMDAYLKQCVIKELALRDDLSPQTIEMALRPPFLRHAEHLLSSRHITQSVYKDFNRGLFILLNGWEREGGLKADSPTRRGVNEDKVSNFLQRGYADLMGVRRASREARAFASKGKLWTKGACRAIVRTTPALYN